MFYIYSLKLYFITALYKEEYINTIYKLFFQLKVYFPPLILKELKTFLWVPKLL